jgi:hypothetical protein
LSNGFFIEEITELKPSDLRDLSQLLIEVVADGASIA